MVTMATIAYEKCKSGVLHLTKVRRLSGGLVAIGYTLWVPALLLLLLVTSCGIFTVGAGSSASSKVITQAREETAARLEKVYGLPPAIVTEFRKTGTVSPQTLAGLSEDQRKALESATSGYAGQLAGAGIGGAAVTGIAGIVMIVAYIVLLPLFIIGLLLTLKKKVWRCPACGYVFDRP
jgi:hypothetical protein